MEQTSSESCSPKKNIGPRIVITAESFVCPCRLNRPLRAMDLSFYKISMHSEEKTRKRLVVPGLGSSKDKVPPKLLCRSQMACIYLYSQMGRRPTYLPTST